MYALRGRRGRVAHVQVAADGDPAEWKFEVVFAGAPANGRATMLTAFVQWFRERSVAPKHPPERVTMLWGAPGRSSTSSLCRVRCWPIGSAFGPCLLCLLVACDDFSVTN